MKTSKNVLLYLQVTFYLFMGSMHFVAPEQYLAMMPSWLPMHKTLIFLSGAVEILLAILLVPLKTRTTAARLILLMLMVFLFTIHIPESVGYYLTGSNKFGASLLRIPIQMLFLAGAWIFAKRG